MSASTQPHIAIPHAYAEFLAGARSLGIAGVAFREPPFESVADYATLNEPVPAGFPRPHEHFVIADHLIDLPVIAVDCCSTSEHYERVLGYSGGDHWVVAGSLAEFITSMREAHEAAFFGRHKKT